MGRKYELKKRAQRMEETRRRIVEAAVDLHRTIGPARTTVSAITERAGVQRHTYYSHFPDERDLFMACSGFYMERNPLPDPEPWCEVADPEKRLRRGLLELYEYYERNEPMVSSVARDAEVMPLMREIVAVRRGAVIARMRDVLAQPFRRRGMRRERLLAVLEVALDFRTWQTLVRRSGLSRDDAVEAMVAAVACQ
jgi:AcrR family transcriptional regulator